jgi:nucleotide-binding universal stress UspA family protein
MQAETPWLTITLIARPSRCAIQMLLASLAVSTHNQPGTVPGLTPIRGSECRLRRIADNLTRDEDSRSGDFGRNTENRGRIMAWLGGTTTGHWPRLRCSAAAVRRQLTSRCKMKPLGPESHIALKKILLATDFSAASEAALPHALNIAGHYGSILYVAHVICPEFAGVVSPEMTPTTLEQAQGSAQQEMERWLSAGRQRSVWCQPLIGEGAIWDVLLDMIHQNGIDLVVVGTAGRRGLRKLLLGSVAEEVFRMSPCPVLTVGPKTSETPSMDVQLGHILYPVEFVPDSSDAAAYAVSLAEEYRAKLTLMRVFGEVVPSAEEKAQLQQPVRHWMDDHIPAESDLRERISFELGFGPTAEAIVEFAGDRGVDLIVMGVQRLDPVMAAHLPKPDTAYEVVRTAPCPVLTVR